MIPWLGFSCLLVALVAAHFGTSDDQKCPCGPVCPEKCATCEAPDNSIPVICSCFLECNGFSTAICDTFAGYFLRAHDAECHTIHEGDDHDMFEPKHSTSRTHCNRQQQHNGECATCKTNHFGPPNCNFCTREETCQNHGTCDTNLGTCNCDIGYMGSTCGESGILC